MQLRPDGSPDLTPSNVAQVIYYHFLHQFFIHHHKINPGGQWFRPATAPKLHANLRMVDGVRISRGERKQARRATMMETLRGLTDQRILTASKSGASFMHSSRTALVVR